MINMTWHHRAAAMRRNSTKPWTTLAYLPVYLHMFDAPTIRRIDMLVGRYLDRSDNFAAPDIKPCME